MFPGATADPSAPAYTVVGAPLDVSTSFRPGTRFGPERVRRFAGTFEDYDRATDQSFSTLGVADRGDVHAWTDAEEYLDYLTSVCREVVRDGATPLVLGGEHTVSLAPVRALDPEVVVVCDAHLDLREAYDGDPWSHSTVTRHALDTADEAVILGARSGSEAEWERADAADVTVVEPAAVAEWTPPAAFADRDVYLSVDVDAADPAYAPGTGTPEPYGLTSRELRDVVRAVAPHAAGFDVVEVNDRDDGQAATLAAKLLRDFVFAHADANADTDASDGAD
ncbi:agmatinase [Halarchaeum rubridurum]|uniref:Agmatinase n=1 Tax=Halarchaeum rubridurum TaxID=489911 RepID=A0A830FWX3_9EURY|nr:agmatinase [Halarchaeum rubridurum]MBP1953860.1 agmatinase [Halarchaeum rubridurum]GGM55398.1 agmatinase [Halarchaeum rubridurum]